MDLHTKTSGSGKGAKVTVVTDNKKITDIIVTERGTGYVAGDTLTISYDKIGREKGDVVIIIVRMI